MFLGMPQDAAGVSPGVTVRGVLACPLVANPGRAHWSRGRRIGRTRDDLVGDPVPFGGDLGDLDHRGDPGSRRKDPGSRARSRPQPGTREGRPRLFDHLGCAQHYRWGYGKTERLGGLEVHSHVEFCRQLNG